MNASTLVKNMNILGERTISADARCPSSYQGKCSNGWVHNCRLADGHSGTHKCIRCLASWY